MFLRVEAQAGMGSFPALSGCGWWK